MKMAWAVRNVGKTVLHMNVGLDQALAQAVDSSAAENERTYNQEVRYVLRRHYGLDRTPAEASGDAVSA